MKTYRNLYESLCSYENLLLAFKKARKGKTQKQYIIDFEKDLKANLIYLRLKLFFQTYKPKPLTNFIIRDPKTRKISKSEFPDRIIHHAICNIIEQILEKSFIYDSYANRKGKGTLKAINRFDRFKRKVSKNNSKQCYILKVDIKHYFENVNHKILINILNKKIKDEKLINLIKIILKNYSKNKGMPLGNLTSQFFANVYLNELDQFIKKELKVKYYIRYVDDFVIFHNNKEILEGYKLNITNFLKTNLHLELHPQKTKIRKLKQGIDFLGFRIFYYHKLLRKSNLRKFNRKLDNYIHLYNANKIDYDKIYDFLEGWFAYIKNANTYKLREKITTILENGFINQTSTKEINRYLKMFRTIDKINKICSVYKLKYNTP